MIFGILEKPLVDKIIANIPEDQRDALRKEIERVNKSGKKFLSGNITHSHSNVRLNAPEPKAKEPWMMTREEFYQFRRSQDLPSANRMVKPDFALIEKETGIQFKEGDDLTVRPIMTGGKTPKISFTPTEEDMIRISLERQGFKTDKRYRVMQGRTQITKDIGVGAGLRVIAGDIYPTTPEYKRIIQQALSEGKPVPPEVLKDYPDLQSQVQDEFIKTQASKSRAIIDSWKATEELEKSHSHPGQARLFCPSCSKKPAPVKFCQGGKCG
ncbi:MAG: hypothetical protein Q8R31_05875 [Candidatus Omnitrophota bacterium]|nr:hypothetical protein [Candidatus Omnitrophota bacterium]